MAVVVIRSPHLLDDSTLRGIGLTLSQLSRLGLNCVAVSDHTAARLRGCSKEQSLHWRREAFAQADRVVAGIEHNHRHEARRLDSVIDLTPVTDEVNHLVKVRGRALVANRDLILRPLRRGVIPVIASFGYTDSQVALPLKANETVLALTREFAGLSGELHKSSTADSGGAKKMSLDRLIILDQNGSIPKTSTNGHHVFINLEQEYEDIRQELWDLGPYTTASPPSIRQLGQSAVNVVPTTDQHGSSVSAHLENLELARDTLTLLPPSSSALLTTPTAAARSQYESGASTAAGVGTRPQRNVLIHNLLTDKPIYSSSLPRTRLGSSVSSDSPTYLLSTFIKRGMPLTVLPSPKSSPWVPPTPDSPPLSLSDPHLDLPRLIHLIEDSFGRPLDAKQYLARIAPSLAGIIIAGSYEGGAILTWECPPHAPANNTTRLVPYLDKFAVLKRSQGAGGVADVVFSAMVRECFPNGVCWRSRSNNPVNKWYFERARGSWKIPPAVGQNQGWTMFWTTDGLTGERWGDYEAVCRSVGTSWADGKKVLD